MINVILTIRASLIKYFCFRQCSSDRSDGDQGLEQWRHELSSSILTTASNIVTALLEHPLGKYFTHNYQHQHRSTVDELPHSEEASLEHNTATEEPITNQTGEYNSEADHQESQDCSYPASESSLASEPESLPSSLSTDAPPSIFSYSSFESYHSPDNTSPDLSNINLARAQHCRVVVSKMSLLTWVGHNNINDAKKPVDNEECKNIESNSVQTCQDVLDISEDEFVYQSSPSEDGLEERYANFALELNELSEMVKSEGVTSVMDLYLNIKKIIEDTIINNANSNEVKQEILSYYLQVFQDSFPWFNVESPAECWSEWEPQQRNPAPRRQFNVKLPSTEHSYAANHDKNRKRKHVQDTTVLDNWYDAHEDDDEKHEDKRKCCLCGSAGDDDESGRLLPYRFNEWIHLNCALWSSEVR